MSKAVQFDSYGGIDVLEVRDVPRPVPGAGEVLVEVKAAGINPSEAVIRSGALHHMFPATFPSGQGSDFAGIVAELGPGVSGVAVGDEVIGFSMRRSSHAEYVTVPTNQLTPRPAKVPWEVAGSLFVAGVTAYAAGQVKPALLIERTKLRRARRGRNLYQLELSLLQFSTEHGQMLGVAIACGWFLEVFHTVHLLSISDRKLVIFGGTD
jgi:D-arabinose 1-dehydrogenase-like Zn-dependent alcohol dehydrogenase